MKPGLSLPLLLRRSLFHRRGRTAAELIALTVSAAVATALLTLYASLDQKLHHQFRAFGANIVVTGHSSSGNAPLPGNAFEIARKVAGGDTGVVPFVYAVAQAQNGTPIVIAGTDMAAVRHMNSWWQVSRWPGEPTPVGSRGQVEALVGVRAAQALPGDQFSLLYNGRALSAESAGTLRTGDADDSRIYLPLEVFENWTGLSPTTLEIQVPGDAQHVQAVLQRLRQALPQAEVHAVHQLVEAESNVVSRTRSLMLSSLVLIALTVAISVLATLTASVFERRHDFAIMKALGATQRNVTIIFLAEAVLLAMLALVCGYLLGCGIADLIGQWNFHTSIAPVWRVLPQVALLNLVVALLAAAIPMRLLRRLDPATLLRGE
ncbi:MAG TPA: FtsX-like permease family protein [Acidobacteriaceae bacterium]|nr:FtsX-like permease family protein [Acidobacteriaceae bacterium]